MREGESAARHAMERAWERYRVEIDVPGLARLEADCREGRSALLRRERDGSETHIVRHGSAAMVAVYWPSAGRIATFLPPRRHHHRWRMARATPDLNRKGEEEG